MSSLYIPPFGGTGDNVMGGPGSRVTQGLRGDGGSRTQAINIGGKARLGGSDGGMPASRQLSRSYFVPRSLEGYERHLRQIECEGYLQRQSRTTGTWRRRWFLLKDGYLSYFQDQDEAEVYRSEADAQLHHHPSSQRQLSLDCVEAVRTDEKLGPLVIRVISSHRDDLVLRAESKESMNEWLFGFHRALASIIARYMENRGEDWEEERDWRVATHGGAGFDGADGTQRDPFRATTPSQVRKVLGHGHGRARRLSLRQWRGANGNIISNKLNIRHSRLQYNGGTGGHSGTRSHGHNTPSGGSGKHQHYSNTTPSLYFTPAYGGDPNMGAGSGNGPGIGSGGLFGTPGSSKGNNSARPPKPSPHRGNRSRRSIEDRRRRAESLGGLGGSGSWVSGLYGPSGGMELGLGPLPAVGSFCLGLSRAVSAGHEPVGDGVEGSGIGSPASREDFVEESSLGAGGLDDGFELSEDDYLSEEHDEKSQSRAPTAAAAAATAAAFIHGSSGEESHDDKGGRSSESGPGSTSDEERMEGPGSSLTCQEAFGLGLGMDVEAHSILQDRGQETYIPKQDRGVELGLGGSGLGGGGGGGGIGGGKYVPPAMRAAAARARAEAEAAALRGTEGDQQASHPWPPSAVPPQIDVSFQTPQKGSNRTHDDSSDDDDSGGAGGTDAGDVHEDESVFASLGMDLSESSRTPKLGKGDSSSSVSASASVGAASVAANASPPFGGGGGGTTFAVLPNGVTLPWSPAEKEHYYTGDYHSRRPCYPEGECNARGGGHGGGPAPSRRPNTRPCSASDDVGHGTAAGEHGGIPVSEWSPTGTEGVASAWTGNFDPGPDGLWWSCGAWSIMGRREKQEDRFCVMPDFNKSLKKRRTTSTPPVSSCPAQTQNVTSPAPPPNDSCCSSNRGDGPSTNCSERQSAVDVSIAGKEECGSRLAQGFFGVYDGHCGSEAVQFVRDRLHAMIGEHESFVKEPRRAMREAFVAADEEFLSLAGERDWYSGTTVLVALIRGRTLVIANVGDGEAVLCRKGKAVHMSPVHNPGRADENRRILEAGGWVTTEQELFLRQLKQMDLRDPEIRMAATDHVRWTTITRVCGELAVSRSIGDRDFKGFTKRRLEQGTEGVAPLEMTVFSWPNGHSGEFRDDLLTPEPEFQIAEIDGGDEFLLMACDGLWDVLGKDEAVEHARKFFDEGLCAQAVAERMCELAYRMGTSDNVTAVVVQFLHTTPCC